VHTPTRCSVFRARNQWQKDIKLYRISAVPGYVKWLSTCQTWVLCTVHGRFTLGSGDKVSLAGRTDRQWSYWGELYCLQCDTVTSHVWALITGWRCAAVYSAADTYEHAQTTENVCSEDNDGVPKWKVHVMLKKRCVTFIIVNDLGLHDFLLVSVLKFLHKCFTARNYMLA